VTEREQFVLDMVNAAPLGITSWDADAKDAFRERFGGSSLTVGERLQRVLTLLHQLRLIDRKIVPIQPTPGERNSGRRFSYVRKLSAPPPPTHTPKG